MLQAFVLTSQVIYAYEVFNIATLTGCCNLAGRFVASDEMDSAMVYDFKSDSGFAMLHSDSHSRPVSHCLAIQNPLPSQATVAAVDREGRALFLTPRPESFGPERNMFTAVQYTIGQMPAGIVHGTLRQTLRDDISNAVVRPLGHSSCCVATHQDLLSSSALPAAGVSPEVARASNVGSNSGSAVDPPEPTGRPQGDCRACLPFYLYKSSPLTLELPEEACFA